MSKFVSNKIDLLTLDHLTSKANAAALRLEKLKRIHLKALALKTTSNELKTFAEKSLREANEGMFAISTVK